MSLEEVINIDLEKKRERLHTGMTHGLFRPCLLLQYFISLKDMGICGDLMFTQYS
jgi:hypothetical protein